MSAEYITLEFLKIPTEIIYTDKLVESLMRIAECRPFLTGALSTPLEVSLLRNAKVRTITYSNQIEGNTLSEEKVAKVIRKNKKEKKDKEILEIQNYSDALSYTETLAKDSREIKISDFCDLQRLVTEGLIQKSQLGKLRTIQVSIGNAVTKEKIDTCPEPHILKAAIDDLWRWLNNTKQANPYLRAFAFHFIAVAIHPFADGNGRTCRLMQHLLLLKSGEELVRYVPSETAIMKYRADYYTAIRQSKKLKNMSPILEFLAACFVETAEEVTREAKAMSKATELTKEIREEKILGLFKKKKEIKTKDVIKLFPELNRRTLERDLANLCRNKKIKAIGEKKARVYRVK